jgi:hypothetical protein
VRMLWPIDCGRIPRLHRPHRLSDVGGRGSAWCGMVCEKLFNLCVWYLVSAKTKQAQMTNTWEVNHHVSVVAHGFR